MYNLFDRLKSAGFFGVDVSLEISLFEYNFLMRPTEEKGEYQVILALYNEDFPLKVMFDYGFITEEEINKVVKESWFDCKGFFRYLGCTKKDWLKLPVQMKFNDLISYYSPEEFGFSCYFPCSIYSLARTYKIKE